MDYKEDGDTLIYAKTTYKLGADGHQVKVNGKAVEDYEVKYAEKAYDATTNIDGYKDAKWKYEISNVRKDSAWIKVAGSEGDWVATDEINKAGFLRDVDLNEVINLIQ